MRLADAVNRLHEVPEQSDDSPVVLGRAFRVGTLPLLPHYVSQVPPGASALGQPLDEDRRAVEGSGGPGPGPGDLEVDLVGDDDDGDRGNGVASGGVLPPPTADDSLAQRTRRPEAVLVGDVIDDDVGGGGEKADAPMVVPLLDGSDRETNGSRTVDDLQLITNSITID